MSRKSRKNVGLIGLGIIGARVATGLRAAGYHVFVWNRTPKPAPNFLGSPAEVAENCDIIQIFVADAQALFEVLDQMGDALTPRHIILCNSTVGPEAVIEAARLVEEKGARLLDAPFTGSRGAAEKRDLVYYVGGDEAVYLRAKPVLEASSKAIVRMGEIGHAATIKVVTNMIAAVSIQTLGEALAIVQKAGLDPEVLAAALEQNACRSGTMDLKLPKMVLGDYEPHFSLKHMFKDVQLGIHIANALDIEIPATTVTAGVMYGALNQGWAELDFSSLYKVYESQIKPAQAAAELPAVVELDDLDPKELHYPETKIPAPPRPAADGGRVESADKKGGAPTLADMLSAPDSLKSSDPHKSPETGEPVKVPELPLMGRETKSLTDLPKAPEPAPAPVAEVIPPTPPATLVPPTPIEPAVSPDPAPTPKPAEAEHILNFSTPLTATAPSPGMITLAPLVASATPSEGAIILGASETPKPAPVEPPKAEAAPIILSPPAAEAPKPADIPEPEKAPAEPAKITPEPVSEAASSPSATIAKAPDSDQSGEAKATGDVNTSKNGSSEETDSGSAGKPFNFVKRWFVSRRG